MTNKLFFLTARKSEGSGAGRILAAASLLLLGLCTCAQAAKGGKGGKCQNPKVDVVFSETFSGTPAAFYPSLQQVGPYEGSLMVCSGTGDLIVALRAKKSPTLGIDANPSRLLQWENFDPVTFSEEHVLINVRRFLHNGSDKPIIDPLAPPEGYQGTSTIMGVRIDKGKPTTTYRFGFRNIDAETYAVLYPGGDSSPVNDLSTCPQGTDCSTSKILVSFDEGSRAWKITPELKSHPFGTGPAAVSGLNREGTLVGQYDMPFEMTVTLKE